MSTRARTLGSAGAVLDGMHRDSAEILSVGFPVFSRGAFAQDVSSQRGLLFESVNLLRYGSFRGVCRRRALPNPVREERHDFRPSRGCSRGTLYG